MKKFPKTQKTKRKRMDEVLSILSKSYQDVTIQLNFSSPFELLLATILSAQCTDKQVNKVTSELFKKYSTPEDFAQLPVKKLEKLIYSTGFYSSKSKNIKASADMIIKEFDGQVPGDMKNLLKLPGVGRKTANVLLGHLFDTPGIVVDTHVIRISNRLGFVDSRDAYKIEIELMKLIDEEEWVIFTHYFINHGRKVCKSRNPICNECQIAHLCPSRSDFDNK